MWLSGQPFCDLAESGKCLQHPGPWARRSQCAADVSVAGFRAPVATYLVSWLIGAFLPASSLHSADNISDCFLGGGEAAAQEMSFLYDGSEYR